jgi:hypothetical protein
LERKSGFHREEVKATSISDKDIIPGWLGEVLFTLFWFKSFQIMRNLPTQIGMLVLVMLVLAAYGIAGIIWGNYSTVW